MAGGALASGDVSNKISAGGYGQGRGGGMAFGAGILVNAHRVIGQMAECDAGQGVGDSAQAAGGVIHQAMLIGIDRMADQAAGRIEVGVDDDWNRRAGSGTCLAGGVVAGIAGAFMQAKDAGKGVGKLIVAGVAVLPLRLIDAGPHAHGMGMAVVAEISGVAAVALAALADGRA